MNTANATSFCASAVRPKAIVVVAVALAALAGLGADGVVTRVGAVNWDCSVPSYTFFGKAATSSLGPEKFRDRTPYYAHAVGKDKIEYRYRTLAEYEQEMRYAIDAGIDYFAYCWYDLIPQKPVAEGFAAKADGHLQEITKARLNHVKSPLRDKLHLCAILVSVHAYSNEELLSLALEMREPWYEKVGERPLVYMFHRISDELPRLRDICRQVGAGDPYAVLMGGRPHVPEIASQVEALGAYAYSGNGADFAEFTARSIASNAKRAGIGKPVIPHFATGWDPTPRIDNPVPWGNYPAGRPYRAAQTRDDFLHGARELSRWIGANAKSCPTGHVLAFAWNEFEEGGWICPTLGKDGRPDTWRVEAFRAAVDVLKGRSGQTP